MWRDPIKERHPWGGGGGVCVCESSDLEEMPFLTEGKRLATLNCFLRVDIHDSSPNGIRNFGGQESGTCTAGK